MRAILAAAAAAVVLVGVHLVLGGGAFSPSKPPDPCHLPPARSSASGVDGTLERVGVTALAGAACELGVTRERLLVDLAGDERSFTEDRRADAFRKGLRDAIDAEEGAGRLDDRLAFVLRRAVDLLPVDTILDQLFGE
jgi:hypothetical protein